MKSKYKIQERTLYSGEKEYVIKQRFLWFFWITKMVDMGLYISIYVFDTLEEAEIYLKQLLEKIETIKLNKVKSWKNLI